MTDQIKALRDIEAAFKSKARAAFREAQDAKLRAETWESAAYEVEVTADRLERAAATGGAGQ